MFRILTETYRNITPDQQGYLKFAVGGTGVLITGVALWALNGLRPVFDDELCIVNQPPSGHQVKIVDISEAEDAFTLADVIRKTSELLPQHHRLSLYRMADLNETPTDAERALGLWPLVRMFSACNPGRGDQVNPWIVGSRYAERRYQKMFAAPLDEVIQATAARAGAQTSPILNALAQVPNIKHFGFEVAARTLDIRSDLLQHTLPQYTQYTANIKNVDYALSQIGVSVPDLGDIEVHVDFVQRLQYTRWQTDDHRAFWTDYFERAGAPGVLIRRGEKVPGMNEQADYVLLTKSSLPTGK